MDALMSRKLFAFATLLTGVVFFDSASVQAQTPPMLTLTDASGVRTSYSIELLKLQFRSQSMLVENPAYHAPKAYQGVSLAAILKRLMKLPRLAKFDRFLKELRDKYEIEITCADGYQPILDASFFKKDRKALMAYQELEMGKPYNWVYRAGVPWSLVQDNGKTIDPAPFYLVWNTTETYPNGWPFQVTGIRLVKKEESQKRKLAEPNRNLPFNEDEFKAGFKVFAENCFVCHAIQGVGPSGKAPDLGEALAGIQDKELTEFWLPRMQQVYTKKALSEEETKNLIAYLRNKQK
jgi:cytochrome c2